ncbi:MAG: hypothetical protein HJJLKODD_00274 [Phycisphaerae bacterium]|nr:hypothetical protein [Phycisphaerae bacterium]
MFFGLCGLLYGPVAEGLDLRERDADEGLEMLAEIVFQCGKLRISSRYTNLKSQSF